MILILRKKADAETIAKVAEELKGYVKVAVDLKREILAAGGSKHVDCEDVLLKDGSQQEFLWGAGIDLETNEVDFDSMINIRPKQKNSSREILDPEIRRKVEYIIRSLIRE